MKLVSITVDLSRARWRKSSFSGGGGSNCVEVSRRRAGDRGA